MQLTESVIVLQATRDANLHLAFRERKKYAQDWLPLIAQTSVNQTRFFRQNEI